MNTISEEISDCPNHKHTMIKIHNSIPGWTDGWIGFNGILSTQVVAIYIIWAISCPRKFKVY